MLRLLRTKDGILCAVAWFSVWMTLEMVFYGEPMFSYSASQIGYAFYLAELALVAVMVLAISLKPGFMGRISALFSSNPKLMSAVAIASSLSLFGIRALVEPSLPIPVEPFLLVCTVVFSTSAVAMSCLWVNRTAVLVFEHGLRSVLGIVLVGIALSFLLLPRTLRDTPYGITMVGLTPLLMGLTYYFSSKRNIEITREQVLPAESPEEQVGVQDLSQKCIAQTLAALATFSFLVYLISYFDFVVPAGFKVVVDEDPYFYLAVFVLIGILAASIAFVENERVLTSKLFLYVLFGIMILSLIVFFGVLSYAFEGGDYMYALTKVLRRCVKIAMLYVILLLVYQNALPADRSFAVVVMAPLVFAKLVQMIVVTVPELQAFVYSHQYSYFAGIGFLSIVTWSFILVSYVQGHTLFYTVAEAEGLSPASPEPVGATNEPQPAAQGQAGKEVREAAAYGLTEREADVLAYLSAGYSLRAISGALCVSQNTVKTHVGAIYRKMGLHSRQEIIDLLGNGPK